MASYLMTFSLPDSVVRPLEAITPPGRRQRSRTVRAVFLGAALFLVEGGKMSSLALPAGQPKSLGRLNVTASLDSSAVEVVRRLSASTHQSPGRLLIYFLASPEILALAQGILRMGEKERQEMEELLLYRLKEPPTEAVSATA